nr:serine/threonine protein kinase [Thermocatellispora tengchongensis]
MGKLRRVGPYTLLERLGRGGMGEVYLADSKRGERVALKLLREPLHESADARLRLEREVRALRRVESPYVTRVLDADLTGDRPYLVMEHIEGETLLERVRRSGPFDRAELVHLAQGIAAGLAIIHAAGVVHRDLKPGNVLLGPEGPILIDFGIAQMLDATRLTLTGTFLGTPGYAAPELFTDEPVGEPADIHAWAATVAFAATGRPTFGRGTVEAQMYAILNGHADLAGVPAALLPLVKAALNRTPAKRPTAAVLSDRLSRLARASSGPLPLAAPVAAGVPEAEAAPQAAPPPDGKQAAARTEPPSGPDTGPSTPVPARAGTPGTTPPARTGTTPQARTGTAPPARTGTTPQARTGTAPPARTGTTPQARTGTTPAARTGATPGKPAADAPAAATATATRRRAGARGGTGPRTTGSRATGAPPASASARVAGRVQGRRRDGGGGAVPGSAVLVLLALLAVPCVVASVIWPIAAIGVTAACAVLTRTVWLGHWMVRNRRSARTRALLRIVAFPLTLALAALSAAVWPGLPAGGGAALALWAAAGGDLGPGWWERAMPVTVAAVVFGVLCGGIVGREIERMSARLPALRREPLRALAVLGGFVALCVAAVRAIALLL